MHLAGRKRDYDFRIDSYERAGRAGIRKLNLGILLGLFNWREDVCWLAIHARHMQRACWRSSIALSFPRLRNVPDGFVIPSPVSDAHLVQIILALRMFLPEAGFTLSTRESAVLRDHLIPLGITQMSAGSSTRPGGYAARGEETLEQFAIDDARSPEEVVETIRRAGYAPIWKDFDSALV
jgi:2-iminoacetate synthase